MGYPFEAFIEEARFSYPYMDWLRTADAPIAYNLEMSRGGMAAIDRVATSTGYKYIMLDWKRFDKHVPAWLLRGVFDFSHIQCSEKKIWKVRCNRSTNRWNFMVDYFINTPIRTSKRERWIKDHGVPPGSGFTNLIDTIVNAIMVRYCYYQQMGEYPLFDVYLGDDSLAIVPPKARVSLEGIAEVALNKFSAVLNTEKSYITTNRNNISFLGYYNDNGRPTRDQAFLIASACFPEHPIFQDSDTLARCIGQMWTTLSPEAAYKWYLVCEDICEYIGMTMDQGYFSFQVHNDPRY